MTTSPSRRWPLAALFSAFFMPLGAWAQTLDLDVTPNDPVTVNAGEATTAGFGLLNTTGGVLNNIEIQVGALPTGVTWGTCTVNTGYDISNLGTTGLVTLASLADAAIATLLCDLEVAPDVAAATVFNLAAFWTADVGVTDTSADITVARESDLEVTVVNNSPVPVVVGQDSTDIVFTVTNLGPSEATGVMTELTQDVAFEFFSCGWSSTQGSLDVDQISPIVLTWDIGDLPVGQAASLTLSESCTPAPSAEDGQVITTTLAITGQDNPDPDSTNDSASASFELAREFDLALAVVDAPDPVLAGSGTGNLTHEFTLSRSGPSDAAGVQVDLVPTLPAGVTLDSAVASVGSVAGTTWTVGDWPASENGIDQTLTLTLTVASTAADCTDCVSAEGTVSAASGTDTNADNDTAVDPTSIETAASAPTGFATSIVFTNGYDGTVTVTLTCNTGVPLQQSFDIDSTSGVDFVITNLDFVAPATDCEIGLDLESGYTASVLANGVDTGASCLYSGDPAAGEAPFDLTTARANTCAITAEPVQSSFVVSKVWEGLDPNFDLTANLTIECAPASEDTGSTFGTVSMDVTAEGNESFTLDFYPSWSGTTMCYVTESNLQSGIESSSSCENGVLFVIGDTEKSCTVTNTVFFEGIPTLSQWGLALMALLMLGVGFIGFRRIV